MERILCWLSNWKVISSLLRARTKPQQGEGIFYTACQSPLNKVLTCSDPGWTYEAMAATSWPPDHWCKPGDTVEVTLKLRLRRNGSWLAAEPSENDLTLPPWGKH